MSTLQDRQSASRAAHRRPWVPRRLSTLRKALEAAVERALAALDVLDGDPDLEPWLGALDCADQRRWSGPRAGRDDGREQACEDEGAQCEGEAEESDTEPSLGWPNPYAAAPRPGEQVMELVATDGVE